MGSALLALCQALESSDFAAFIRQAVWVYPAANVLHVLAVIVFAGAVTAIDVRLMGGFAGSAVASVLRGGRLVAMEAFGAILVTGGVLFTAEAGHLAVNPVFQTKMLLIALAFLNVLVFEIFFARRLAAFAPRMPMPAIARASGFASLATWLAVAACGRSIAYF
jgi:hypothetical protein